MDIDIIAGLVSFAALILVWALAPSKPVPEPKVIRVPAPSEAPA